MSRVLRLVALALVCSAFVPVAAFGQVVSCPEGLVGDVVSRSFYVPNFTGSSLSTVRLRYGGDNLGSFTVTLTARAGTFDGALIGTSQRTVNFASGTVPNPVVIYDFANAPVTPGSIVTFVQTVNVGSAGSLLYDVGIGPCANIIQTDGSTPPLDSTRRNTVATIITAGVSVPTMAGWMTWVLAALLVGGAGYQIRRRRPAIG